MLTAADAEEGLEDGEDVRIEEVAVAQEEPEVSEAPPTVEPVAVSSAAEAQPEELGRSKRLRRPRLIATPPLEAPKVSVQIS